MTFEYVKVMKHDGTPGTYGLTVHVQDPDGVVSLKYTKDYPPDMPLTLAVQDVVQAALTDKMYNEFKRYFGKPEG